MGKHHPTIGVVNAAGAAQDISRQNTCSSNPEQIGTALLFPEPAQKQFPAGVLHTTAAGQPIHVQEIQRC